MRIERRFTKDGQSPYAEIEFRLTTSEIRNPDGSVVFKRGQRRGAGVLVAGRLRRAGAEIFPQGRRARAPEEGRGRDRPLVPVALGRRRGRARRAAREGAHRRRDIRPSRCSTASPAPGPIGAGRAAISTARTTRRPSSTSCATCWRCRWCAPNSPQWFNTGLHWAYGIDGPSQGHYYVDFQTGKLTKSKSSYEHPQPHACFIQSITDDLVNEGGIMDLWVREARLFKYGSGTGTNFSRAARREREARGRRQVVRPDELPQDRRPRGGRDQVGRHHAPRGQDGDRRHRPSRHRAVHRLEGEGGAEGRGARHRLQDQPEAPQGDPEGLRELRRLGRRLLPAGEEPGAEARDQARAAQATCRTTTSSA